MPVSYANPLYTLRGHIALLRDELREAATNRAASSRPRVDAGATDEWRERARRTRQEAQHAPDRVARETFLDLEIAERYKRLGGQIRRQRNSTQGTPAV
jgi:hypothetical protein